MLAYYQRSAGWYAEVAEIDRGHHHEALYMAEQEREHAKEMAAQIHAGMGVRGEDCGKDHGSGAAVDVDAGS
ncbi:MAG: AMED_5909 family protein [Pseudonocardiaceae bacterium]